MADALAPTTELEAINVMLTNIGEAPVNSLESGVGLDASTAQIVLKESSRHTQAIGWFWNSEHVRLSPDSSKNIILPLNTMKVRPIGQSSQYAYVYRSGKLYNREPFTNTFEFDSAVELEITYELPFNDLPETARRYITFVASRMFQERKLGVQSISQQNRNDEARANAVLRQEENHVARRNVGNSSMSMKRILDRQQMSFWRS
tara:strand:+ start:7 stop:618 length:612 start_codon:yes stop_codon:yes gene_type:complete